MTINKFRKLWKKVNPKQEIPKGSEILAEKLMEVSNRSDAEIIKMIKNKEF